MADKLEDAFGGGSSVPLTELMTNRELPPQPITGIPVCAVQQVPGSPIYPIPKELEWPSQ